jgi:hypothetical protein
MKGRDAARFGVALVACAFAAAGAPAFAASVPPTAVSKDEDETEESPGPATPCERLAREDEETPRTGAFRFDVDGACVAVTGSLSGTLQHALAVRGSAGRAFLPVPNAGRTATEPAATQPSTRASFSFDATRFSEVGRVATSVGGAWTWTQGDGTSTGRFQFTEMSFSVGGAKLGFTSSLTSFFEGDLLATAFTPARFVGLVSHETEIAPGTSVAIALETGAATGTASTRLVPVSFASNPYLVLRLRHDLPNGTLHLAGALTRDGPERFGFQTSRTGFAATFGASFDLEVGGHRDNVAAQFAYAIDALPYLGAPVDLAGLFPRLADFGSARGVSAVASYTRNWSDAWASTAFVSAVAIDGTRPSVARARSLRYGVNLFWRASETLRLGAEISMLHSRVERTPVVQRAPGTASTGDAAILLLSATFSF